MGAGRFSGLKTEQIVDRTPLVVLSFLNSNTLIPDMSDSMRHYTPSALSV